MKITTPFNYEITQGEINLEPSLTIPGQVMSLTEMIRRAQMGERIPSVVGEFSGDEVVNTIHDLTDIDVAKLELEEIKSNALKRSKAEEMVPDNNAPERSEV